MASMAVRMSAPRRAWSTLRLLKTARLVILLLDALLLMAVVSATEVDRAALKTVGKDTGPSIIAAQHIRSAMAAMDAEAANELLQPPASSRAAMQNHETRRVEAARALIAAAENITFGDAERMPIQSLQVGLGTYERLVQRARDLHERDDPGAVAAYREAATVMDTILVPAAADLDRANSDFLKKTYRAQNLRSSATRFFAILLALSTVVALAFSQMMLSQRMHRTFNPPLLAATVVTLVLAAFTMHALSESHESLKIAKDGAFTSVHLLWQARAAAYAANADESRFLLDGANGAKDRQDFQRNTDEVAEIPAGLDAAQLEAALREGRQVGGFSGYLADELNRTTFHGEREAALAALAALQRYREADAQVQLGEQGGRRKDAGDLRAKSTAGQSARAFRAFDDALWNTLVIDQAAFFNSIGQGYAAVHNLEWEAGIAILFSMVLVFTGFAPRIREYQ